MQRGLLTFVPLQFTMCCMLYGWTVVVPMLLNVVMEDDDIIRRRDTNTHLLALVALPAREDGDEEREGVVDVLVHQRQQRDRVGHLHTQQLNLRLGSQNGC